MVDRCGSMNMLITAGAIKVNNYAIYQIYGINENLADTFLFLFKLLFMQRIPTLLKKISELAERGDSNTAIDIDLMMDYTRVVYADLMEWRNRKSFVSSLDLPATNSTNGVAPIEEEYEREDIPVVKEQVKEEKQEEPSPKIEFVVNAPVVEHKADVRQSIGINDKYLFMSELFGNSRDKYEYALDKINTLGSYAEAEKWLKDNLDGAQNSDEENDTLQSFHSMLGLFYSNQ